MGRPAAALFMALIVAWQLAVTVFRLREYLLPAANDSYAPNIRGAGQP
jgi:ABC-type nitrate/sulfonate/bicarbonate transport system permease component